MKNKKILIFYIIFFAAVIIFASTVTGRSNAQRIENYSELIQMFEENKVQKFVVRCDSYVIELTDTLGKKWTHTLSSVDMFYLDVKEYLDGVESYNYIPATLPWWITIIPYLAIGLGMLLFYFMFMKRAGGGAGGGIGGRMNSFGRARTRLGSDEKHVVKFTDVAGADEEKAELEEVVEYLKNPAKFIALGARIPKGVLLVGPPGTGKTLLAKAVAGESGVPFYSISGSDFVEMYVGVGASRVRDLFETAKKTSPCIVFIDEIDAVGRHRGAGLGGGHDEREQTLNQLLVEMDGFGVNDGVIVMAATNRPDILDPALLRPGRFDRQVTVNYPDLRGRVEILKVHARNKPFEDGVDFETIAKSTAGFTGADLANLLNEAALLAARRAKTKIGMPEIHDAVLKIILGTPKKSLIITEEDKRKTAYHEAGHAIVSHACPSQDPVHQISVIPSGKALGYTLTLPQTDKTSVYKTELMESISMMLGGRAAEELVLDDISGGASNDMQRATSTARKMVMKLGMSDTLGPIVYGSDQQDVFLGLEYGNPQRDYSEEIAAKIDAEIHRIITEAYATAMNILKQNRHILDFVADYLVKNEVMDNEQFELCFTEGVTEEMLDAVRERKIAESKKQNDSAENKDGSSEQDTDTSGVSD